LSETVLKVTAIIHSTILAAMPKVLEKLSLGRSFFLYHGMFCYLNLYKKTGGLELFFFCKANLAKAFDELQTSERATTTGIPIPQRHLVNNPLFKVDGTGSCRLAGYLCCRKA
jgi:hypothetical protein